jgi:lipopolysaccharide export system ATP-binding protein
MSGNGNADAVTLEGRGLVKNYGARRVVDEIDVEVQSGEIVGLLGPNGAGKTTTFYMIVGMIRPNAGRVVLAGQDISRLPMYKRARRGLGYLPQEPSVFRRLTVEQNIQAILETLEIPARDRKQRLESLLEEMRLTHVRKNRGTIQQVVSELRARGMGVLITDHNVRETLRITDRAYIMYEGRILLSGPTHVLASDPEARKIYLGERFQL